MSVTPSTHVFRHRAYLHFWIMRVSGGVATQMLSTAIGLQVYDLARDDLGLTVERASFVLGFIGLTQFLPLFVFSLLGGVVADRFDRKAILVTVLSVRSLVVASLLTVALLVASGLSAGAALPAIFIAAAMLGLLNAFFPAAGQALLPRIVPRAELPQAIAWNSLGFQSAAISGPAFGGLLYTGGPQLVYAVSAALFLLAVALIATARTPKHEPAVGARTLVMMREGIGYVWKNKIVFGAISLDLVVVFFGGATALLPVFAREILHVGAVGFGFLRAAPAIGAATVAIVLATRPPPGTFVLWVAGLLAAAAALPFLADGGLALGDLVVRALNAPVELPARVTGMAREVVLMTPVLAAASILLTLAMRPLETRVGKWMLVSVAVYGAAMLAFGASHWFWLSLLALAMTGAADMVSVFVRQSLIQLSTPDAMRGRVSSVSFIFISGSNELGEFESGVAARVLGPVGAVLLGGAAAITAAAVWLKLFPALAETERFEDSAHEDLRAASEPAPEPGSGSAPQAAEAP